MEWKKTDLEKNELQKSFFNAANITWSYRECATVIRSLDHAIFTMMYVLVRDMNFNWMYAFVKQQIVVKERTILLVRKILHWIMSSKIYGVFGKYCFSKSLFNIFKKDYTSFGIQSKVNIVHYINIYRTIIHIWAF